VCNIFFASHSEDFKSHQAFCFTHSSQPSKTLTTKYLSSSNSVTQASHKRYNQVEGFHFLDIDGVSKATIISSSLYQYSFKSHTKVIAVSYLRIVS